MSRLTLLIALLLSAANAQAALQRYVATEHESKWEVSSTPLYCSLKHEIPIYGQVVFENRAAGQLGMVMSVKSKPRKVGLAHVTSEAPSWKHGVRDRDLGKVGYIVNPDPITIDATLARRLLSELEQGMFPTFHYQDWNDGRDEVVVALSAVNIRASLGEFRDCLAKLLPFEFDYIKKSRIYFSYDSSAIEKQEMPRLNELAKYLKADTAVTGVAMYGRTDNKGFRSYNDALGRRRAESVRSYLVEKGVDPKQVKIKIRSYGERQPVASNRTTKGRALNRVVEVKLQK